jgi:competence protein ComEC
MISRATLIKILLLTFLAAICVVVWFVPTSSGSELLTVKFLDVGQGDAIYIETPDGFEVLIDGGSSATVLRQLAKGRSFFDREIDLVVATHPDTDHVGGLVDVLDRYQVINILMTEVNHDAAAARAFELAAAAEPGVTIVTAEAGQVIRLGASTTLRILSPRGEVTNWQSNNASIVIQLVYGDIEFMFTGDAPSTIENYLVDVYGLTLASEVLKLGHHGSKTSTSDSFLRVVSPDYAVVSAGRDNRYGHPAGEVIDRVNAFGSNLVSTAESGMIIFKTDGTSLWLE